MGFLDILEAARGMGNGFLPGNLRPRISDLRADHRLGDAILVRGIAPGKTALDAGVALVGTAILVRHHADNIIALHFSFEGATHTAIGARCDHRMLGLAFFDDGFFGECCSGAGLHTSAAGHAFGIQKAFIHACRNMGGKAAAINRQGKSALHFFAGPNATRADDALCRIEGEIGIGFILGLEAEIFLAAVTLCRGMVFAGITVTNITKSDGSGHVLQFAITIGSTGETIEGMVGNVKFHHAFAQFVQAVVFGVDFDAGCNGRGAGSRRSLAAFDFDEAKPTGSKSFQRIRGAELWNLGAKFHGRPHDRRALRHCDFDAIDFKRYHDF